jgi:nucleotide-binding universal stress UspA family protein
VVVGVDGSSEATHAAQWAAAVADRLAAPLHIVHAMASVGHTLADASITAIHAAAVEDQRDASEKFLRTVADHVHTDHPELTVTTAAVTEPAGEALVEASRHARLVVVGCDDVSPAGALLAGSTTLAVATHAACPMVAWRGADIAPNDRPVVVGADGGPDEKAALAAAFEFADRFSTPLRAVRSWTMRQPGAAVTIPYLIDWDAIENTQRRELTETTDGWHKRYPGVDVSLFVAPDKPSHALLHQLGDAQIVIVGSRRRSPLKSIVLGSTGLNLLHHSPIPVMICPTVHDPA